VDRIGGRTKNEKCRGIREQEAKGVIQTTGASGFFHVSGLVDFGVNLVV
jgi:hypothetical protein